MDYSGDLVLALEQLRIANIKYCEAIKRLKEYQKIRAACAEDVREFRGQPRDMNFKREALDEAILAEKLLEAQIHSAMEAVKTRQSAYDQLKHRAAFAKKQQKEAEAQAKREREKAEEREKRKPKRTPRSEEKFWKDGYEEPPPEAGKPKAYLRQQPKFTRPAGPKTPSAWKLACDEALRDRSTMTSFPDPPSISCGNKSCAINRNQRSLRACQCNIVAALQRDPEYPESLKTERLRWHPDKFTQCPEKHCSVFQAKAQEIFVVANHLYERDGK